MNYGVDNAIKEKRKLNLKDVATDFKTYNFIISLYGLTIDTSTYAQAVHSQQPIVGAYNPSEKKGWLVLSSTIADVGTESQFIPKEKRIIIFEETVVEIKVKSIRNFMKNQTTK